MTYNIDLAMRRMYEIAHADNRTNPPLSVFALRDGASHRDADFEVVLLDSLTLSLARRSVNGIIDETAASGILRYLWEVAVYEHGSGSVPSGAFNAIGLVAHQKEVRRAKAWISKSGAGGWVHSDPRTAGQPHSISQYGLCNGLDREVDRGLTAILQHANVTR
jgi:hypothetical protein